MEPNSSNLVRKSSRVKPSFRASFMMRQGQGNFSSVTGVELNSSNSVLMESGVKLRYRSSPHREDVSRKVRWSLVHYSANHATGGCRHFHISQAHLKGKQCKKTSK